MDVFTPKKRSWVMSRIRGRDTKIEIKTGALLRSAGIRFKRHPKIYGNPDFLVGERTALFCDGDFWHGYRYEERRPRLKRFWRDKIERNMRRDRGVTRKLRRDGYSVIRLWEHDIEKRPDVCIRRIARFMR
ncbi:MAG: very short patch repair endonuclease [Alphaproteobacteria bacterium]|nr:very short patch repair endonuclease [Alphaproteobacteria bacterium]MDA8030021.1 very short patch repair endonuclease [Alphaproteobacteria bacterium]